MNKRYAFYEGWKNKTKLEKAGIKSIDIARKLILKNIPKEEIISIYVKGSFIRREMTRKSDVDTLTILKHSRWLKKLEELKKKYRYAYKPNLEFAGYSLWEMKNNKRTKRGKSDRAAPSRMIQHLDNYELIYGKRLNKKNYYQGDDKKRLISTVKAFRKLFLPMYKRKEIGFGDLVKQVFWLVENYEKYNGRNPPHSFKGIANSIQNEKHIIYDALELRVNPTKDKNRRKNFIRRLETYLDNLEKSLR